MQNIDSFYNVPSPPAPTPGGDKDGSSWLKNNIVLVIVVAVVGFMVIAALIYCLCCRNTKGYHNALYDEDSSMKARI